MRPMLIGTMIFSLTVLPVPSAFATAKDKAADLKLQNVELNAEGKVDGLLLDGQGHPIANKQIEIRTKTNVTKTTTTADGHFTIASDNGGHVAVTVDDQFYAARLWKQGTAPPKSVTKVGIIHGDNVTFRAQGGRGFMGNVSGAQLLGLVLLAGAITAIVLAVDDDDDGS